MARSKGSQLGKFKEALRAVKSGSVDAGGNKRKRKSRKPVDKELIRDVESQFNRFNAEPMRDKFEYKDSQNRNKGSRLTVRSKTSEDLVGLV